MKFNIKNRYNNLMEVCSKLGPRFDKDVERYAELLKTFEKTEKKQKVKFTRVSKKKIKTVGKVS